MANTTFQLRRSSVSGKAPNTSTLSTGELALNITDRKLYSSDGSDIFETGANLTTLSVANLTVTGITVNSSVLLVNTAISANGSNGTAGQVLTTNSTGVYWSTVTGGTGGSVDVAAQYTWTNNHAYTVGANAIALTNATSNWIYWRDAGTAAPTFTTRSAGTKLVLYPTLSGSQADYGLGINSGVLWSSIPGNDAGQYFKWYGGTTEVASLSGTGNLLISGTVNATSYNTGGGYGSATGGAIVNTTIIAVGNASVNVTVNSTSFSGSAAKVGGNTASDLNTYASDKAANAYSNAVSTAASDATTKAGTAYSNATSYADTKAGTAYSNATSYADTIAGTAYTNAVSTAASDATTKAGTAYSNATTFASNADNISSGTLSTARLPATANVSTAINVGSNVNINTSSINVGSLSVKANSIVIAANASIDFDTTTYKPTYQKGRMYWDNEEQTIIVYGDGTSSFEIALGQREWVRTRNSTAYTIPKGTPVYITGVHIPGNPVHGHHPTIAPGDASDYTKSQIIGITGEDIASLAHGYTVVRGYIEGFDTSALTSGQRAHLGFLTPGTIVQNAPEFPNFPTDLGMCLTSDATDGTFYVDLAMHTAERFRTTQDMYVGGDLTVAGDLNVTGNVFATSATNLSVSDNIIYLGGGDTIAPSAITHTGGGLDDMLFHGVFEGASSTTYYVKITSASGSIDKFTWSKDNFATTSGTANVTITAGTYFPLDNGISIAFNADNGHHLGDIWYATAAPINVDLGLVGNYNDTSYKHTGLFRDASDGVYKFFQGYTPEPDAAVNIDTGHASFQFAAVQANTFTGNLLGTANNANNLGGQPSSYYTNATNITTGTLPYAQLGADVVNTSGNFTIGGNLNFNATNTYFTTNMYAKAQIVIDAAGDLVFTNGSGIQANGTWGSAGYVFTTDGSGAVYWKDPGTLAISGSYVQNNDSRVLSGNLNFTGTNVYFTTSLYVGGVTTANLSGVYTTQTMNAAVLSVGSSFIANTSQITIGDGIELSSNGSVGSAGQVLTSNGSTGSPYWSTLTTGAAVVRQQYTASGSQTVFTVTSGYAANNLDVYLNGVKLQNGVEVNVSSGTTFTILSGTPVSGTIIEVVGTASGASVITNRLSYRVVSTSDSIGATTDNLILANSASPITLTLPTLALSNGYTYTVKNINTGAVTVAASGTELIDGYSNLVIQFINSSIGFLSTSAGWIRV